MRGSLNSTVSSNNIKNVKVLSYLNMSKMEFELLHSYFDSHYFYFGIGQCNVSPRPSSHFCLSMSSLPLHGPALLRSSSENCDVSRFFFCVVNNFALSKKKQFSHSHFKTKIFFICRIVKNFLFLSPDCPLSTVFFQKRLIES